MAVMNCVEELLGVQNCSLIGSATEISKGRRLQVFALKYDGSVRTSCPVCGGAMYSHGVRSMGIVSTPHLGAPTKLSIEFPRMRCASCGYVWRPEIGGVDEGHRMTEAAYADIARRSLRLSFREVAEEYPLSHVTVKNAFEDYVRENAYSLRFKVPAFLGIDEKSFKHLGRVTIITDLEHRTVFDMLPSGMQADFDAYFSGLEGLDCVQWISSGMRRPFWKSISRYVPNATWVVDYFHVARGACEALDAIWRSFERKRCFELEKGLECALMKRSRDLSPYEVSVFDRLREEKGCSTLMVAYDLKEGFLDVYDEHSFSREDAEGVFDIWKASIPEDIIYEPFRRLVKTVEDNREYVFNYWDCPGSISSGYMECANRFVGETDANGRGRSFETLRARTLYGKQGFDRIAASDGQSIGPRVDSSGPLFVTGPDHDAEIVEEFMDSRLGFKGDVKDGKP